VGRNKTGLPKYILFGPLDEWFKMGFPQNVRDVDHSGNNGDVDSVANICNLPSASGN
jgi:hypothetical protein